MWVSVQNAQDVDDRVGLYGTVGAGTTQVRLDPVARFPVVVQARVVLPAPARPTGLYGLRMPADWRQGRESDNEGRRVGMCQVPDPFQTVDAAGPAPAAGVGEFNQQSHEHWRSGRGDLPPCPWWCTYRSGFRRRAEIAVSMFLEDTSPSWAIKEMANGIPASSDSSTRRLVADSLLVGSEFS